MARNALRKAPAGYWDPIIKEAWAQAAGELVEEYFQIAHRSFRENQPMKGVETLTDAVRTALGNIAANREWPHADSEDLYTIAAALGSGNGWPENMEQFNQALEDLSPEGGNLCDALGASLSRPDILRFGLYEGDPEGPERDGFTFAQATIELANRLAGQNKVPRQSVQEQMNLARELLERAKTESESKNGGNDLIATELLWGAFVHALIGIALDQNMAHDSHDAFKKIAQRLDRTRGGNACRSSLAAAERLHLYFYHGSLPGKGVQTHTQRARQGVLELIQILEAGTCGPERDKE